MATITNPNPNYKPPMGDHEPLKARVCPNCGAPVKGYECEYCDSVFEHGFSFPTLEISTSSFASLPMLAMSSATYALDGW